MHLQGVSTIDHRSVIIDKPDPFSTHSNHRPNTSSPNNSFVSMIRSNILILISVTLVVIVPSVVSLKCWDCNSYFNDRCGDPFDPTLFDKVDCSQVKPSHLQGNTTQFCRKTRQIINDRTTIIRGCGYIADDSIDKACIKLSGSSDATRMLCSCSKEACNGATIQFNLSTQFLVIVCTSITLLMKLNLNNWPVFKLN